LSAAKTSGNQAKVRFIVYRESMNAQVLSKFLITENLKVHQSNLVRERLESKEEKLEIYFLPLYSPELNPDEYLKNDIKHGIHSKIIFSKNSFNYV